MLKEPLSTDELGKLAAAGQTSVSALINPKSAVFKKMGVNRDEISETRAVELVLSNPRILVRPIIQAPGLFLTGFSEAEYRKLL